MPDYFLQSDPSLNPQFSRFLLPQPRCGAEARAMACALLAEAATSRRHGDIGAAVAAEADALRMVRAAARREVSA